jgi:hypothetical protein
LRRNATLKNAGGVAMPNAPPGRDAVAFEPGVRYASATSSQSPTPAASLTVDEPGFHAACGTRSSTWRRAVSTVTPVAGPTGVPVAASTSSAVLPCQVRKSCAGTRTFAPCGMSSATGESPIAIVAAARFGSTIVFSVMRKSVAPATGFTRSSTRSAAFCAYLGSVGYV